MTAQPHEPLTEEEFLEWESHQPEKHEFVDGYVYPLFGDRTVQGFAGGSTAHAQLAMELGSIIVPAARPCRTYGSDAKLRASRGIRYADLSVSGDERDYRETTLIAFPKLIVEILSESTARGVFPIRF